MCLSSWRAWVFHSEFVTFTDNILSDLPYFFFSLLALWLMQQKPSILRLLMLGTSIWFAYFIRDIGIVLLPTLFVYQIQGFVADKPNKKQLMRAALPYGVFGAFFLMIYVLLPHGSANNFSVIASKFSYALLKENIIDYMSLFLAYFHITKYYLLPILILIFIGMAVGIKRNLHFVVYCLLMCMILLVWPGKYQGTRFIFPLLPFALFFMLKGAWFIVDRVKIKERYFMLLLLLYLVIFLFFNVRAILLFSHQTTNQAYTPEMQQLYHELPAYVKSDEIIGFDKPRLLRLFTDRNAICTDTAMFQQSCATYLLIPKNEYKNTVSKFSKVYESPNYVLIKKDETTSVH